MEFEYLKLWSRAENYLGEDLSDYYCFISMTRDSGIDQESNYNCIKNDFIDKTGVKEFRFNHWGCGWIDVIMIHKSSVEVLEDAEYVLYELEEKYPIYNDDDFSQREYDYACDVWEGMSTNERIKFCKEANESIFAARQDIPNCNLREYLLIDAL